jgi:hypothetical protein
MAGFETIRIEASGVRSLLWDGDRLIDWVGGRASWGLDGSHRRSSVSYSYRFDAVVASGDRRWVVLYERRGTKGLLLKDGKRVREIDRSFYHADVYHFPILLLDRGDGRTLLVHCPDAYDRLEIEDADTGERLTTVTERQPIGFFHSQLTANPSHTRFASAGWVWHPWDAVQWFDVDAALANPRLLDGGSEAPTSRCVSFAEESSAAWLDDTHLVVGASAEPEDEEEALTASSPRLRPNGLAVYDAADGKCIRDFVLEEPAGLIAPIGGNQTLSFYRHPRVISLDSGRLEFTFPELDTGRQIGPIAPQKWDSPPIAVDTSNRRFAVADEKGITIVCLERP